MISSMCPEHDLRVSSSSIANRSLHIFPLNSDPTMIKLKTDERGGGGSEALLVDGETLTRQVVNDMMQSLIHE